MQARYNCLSMMLDLYTIHFEYYHLLTFEFGNITNIINYNLVDLITIYYEHVHVNVHNC